MTNMVDDPNVTLVVYFHGGRWVDANGNEVDAKTAKAARRAMRDATPNAPVIHEAPLDDDELDDEDLDEDGEVSEYEKMTKAQLQAEIDSRNEDREDEEKITPGGTRNVDLIEALEADDEDEEE